VMARNQLTSPDEETGPMKRRQRRATLTDRMVAALPKKRKRYSVADPELSGHYVRVMPSGAKSYAAVARDLYGKQVWFTIGSTDVLKIKEVREEAREAIKRIKAGKPPIEPPPVKPDSFKSVADNWVKRHVEAKKLRSGYEIERILDRYVFPHWGTRDFVDIRRSDIASLLDLIEDENGARQADATLAVIRGIANWYSKRHDDYVSPFVRGMRRAAGKSRTRVLDDGELRAVWRAAATSGTFGALVRMLLLTAQRRETVLRIRWSDISDAGVWTIPKEDRAKGNAGSLKLPAQALAIIKSLPEIKDNPFVFAGRTDGPVNGISKSKAAFDKRSGIANWTLHDLRRTSRSLLPRCGVRPDVSERLMGHVLPGVEGIYDRFAYSDEKADALKRLAALIDEIVTGEPSGRVVRLRKARADA
jgi:integrase